MQIIVIFFSFNRSLCYDMGETLAKGYDNLRPYLNSMIKASTSDNFEEMPKNLRLELSQFAAKTKSAESSPRKRYFSLISCNKHKK